MLVFTQTRRVVSIFDIFFLFLFFSTLFFFNLISLAEDIFNGMNTNHSTKCKTSEYTYNSHFPSCVPKQQQPIKQFITPIFVVLLRFVLFSTQTLLNIDQIFLIFHFGLNVRLIFF